MFHLFPVVMGIILTALVATSTMTLINVDSTYGIKLQSDIIKEFNEFDTALSDYHRNTIGYVWVEDCPPNASSGDPECLYDRQIDPANDGTLDTTVWQSELVPDYMYEPYVSQNSSWSMGTTTLGVYACLEIPVNTTVLKAMEGLLNHYGNSDFRVNNACAPASSLDDTGIKSYSGASIYATKWLNY